MTACRGVHRLGLLHRPQAAGRYGPGFSQAG